MNARVVLFAIGFTVIVIFLGFLWNRFLFTGIRGGVDVQSYATTCLRGDEENHCVKGGLPIRLLFSKNEVVIIPMGKFPRKKGDVYIKSKESEMIVTNQNVVFFVRDDGLVSFVWQPGYEIYSEIKGRVEDR